MNAVFRLGDSGPAVAQITGLLERIGLLGDLLMPPEQSRIAASTSRTYDDSVELAVRAFQQQRGLTVDGVVGPLTFRRLDEARWRLGDRILTHLPGNLMAGDDVYALQGRLLDLGFRVGRVDGYFGPETEGGVREFQRNFGIPPDGTCGPATLKALTRLSARWSRAAPPTRCAPRSGSARPGPTSAARSWSSTSAAGTTCPTTTRRVSDAILHDLAQRVEGRLVAIGVQAFLTTPRWADAPGEETERAAFANRTGADLFVSLALDTSANPDACGVSTYFFGDANRDTWSSVGERFAGLVQREIVARSDLVDLRSHPKTWDILRHTRMPAVRLDAGYLTNPGDDAAAARPRLPRRARGGDRGRGAAVLPQPRGRRPHRRAAGQRAPRLASRAPELLSRSLARYASRRAPCGGGGPAGRACRTPRRAVVSRAALELLARSTASYAGPSASAGWSRARGGWRSRRPSRKSAGTTQWPAAPAGVAERLDRLDPAAQDQVLGHPLHQHPAESPAAVLRRRRTPSPGGRRRR